MTSGFDNLSLALFTSLAPAGVIAFIIMALTRVFTADHERAVRIDRVIALPFAVALLGFIASATHLGTPANALHVFAGVGTSPLSNEVLAAVIFLFVTGSYWMMAFKENFPHSLAKAWLVAACVAGLALLACTSQAYAVRTVPTWNTPFTPTILLSGGFMEGCLLGLLFLTIAQVPLGRGRWVLLACSTLGLICASSFMTAQNAMLSSVTNNEFAASSLVPEYPVAIGFFAAAGIAALILSGISLKTDSDGIRARVLQVIAGVLGFSAVFVARIAFYCLHMTVGF